jgi:hypothetical protein
MFNKANTLFHVKLNRTFLADREPVVNEFLLVIAGFLSKGDRDYIKAFVKL